MVKASPHVNTLAWKLRELHSLSGRGEPWGSIPGYDSEADVSQ